LVASLPVPDIGAPVRLWIDRAFTINGAGTVVTGTLGAGRLRVGQALELNGRIVHVRGLHSLGAARDEVDAVARVAVNLRGVHLDDVGRGDALLTPGSMPTTSTIDVRLGTATAPKELVLHVGTAAVPARTRSMGEGITRLSLAHPLPLQAGDRAVARDPGGGGAITGVLVLDADPPTRRRPARATPPPEDVTLSPGVDVLADRLADEPFAAPEQPELDALGLGRPEIAAAVAAGRLLRLPPAVLLLPDAPDRAVRLLSALPQPFTPSAARQAWGTSRRVAIPLLEHLDRRGATRRLDGALREVVR
jgi:selenocysteine-specific elongation factor